MNLEKYEKGIQKTDFVLENNIAMSLKKLGWSVISSKYYEDDFKHKIREIDLIAYKVVRVQDFDVFSCLIINCKKSESSTWALLCRDLNIKDPNLETKPLHSWSNKASVQFLLSSPNKAQDYYKDMYRLGAKEALAEPEFEIFAFQEMNTKDGSCKNDKAIYDSIISLIKAQAYEMFALPERKVAPCVYQFNLLSVVDANIVRLLFKGDKISSELTTSEHHVFRYIHNKKQSFSKIRFINASIFENKLLDYESLHKANLIWYGEACDEFYADIEKDSSKLTVYLADLKKEIHLKKIFSRVFSLTKKFINSDELKLD